jgi:hypothetical protein
MGRKVGQYVADHYFQPLTGAGGGSLVATAAASAQVNETRRTDRVQPMLAEALGPWQAAGVVYDEPVTLSRSTVNGAASTSDGDHVARTASNPITEVKSDSKKEGNETIYLDLFGLSSNALFTKNRGLGTILNDD